MKNYLLCATVSLLAFVVCASSSQAKTLEDLLVEKGVISKSEADSATSGDGTKIYWNKGTRFEFPDNGFTSSFSIFAQERYTFSDNDEDAGKKNTSSFNIEKARIKISGTALHNEFDYLLNTEFAGPNGAKLLDASLTWNACDWGNLRMGQYKPAFGRQYQTNEALTEFPDRTEVSQFFAVGRQGGASTSMFSEDKQLVATAGVFNGLSDEEGINKPGVDTNQSGFVEVRYNALGQIDSFAEGDIDYTEDLGVSLGLAYGHQDNSNDLGAGLEKVKNDGVIGDINAKVEGFAFHGEYFYSSIDADSYENNIEPTGFYTQLGYFFVPKKFEIAARYALLDCDSGKGLSGTCENSDKVNETGVSLNYFFWKHNLKAQFAYTHLNNRALEETADDVNSNKWIFQLSSWF